MESPNTLTSRPFQLRTTFRMPVTTDVTTTASQMAAMRRTPSFDLILRMWRKDHHDGPMLGAAMDAWGRKRLRRRDCTAELNHFSSIDIHRPLGTGRSRQR